MSQPAFARGIEKRLLDLSIAEAGAALVETELMGADQLEQTLAQMRRAADDEQVLAVMPRMTQVWARKR